MSRRNLNILLAEYPEVGEELKRVARDRASAAKKGSTNKKPAGDSDSSSSETSSEMIVTVPVPLVDVGNKEIEPPPSVQPAALGGNILQQQSDGRHSTLLDDEEIDAIVQSISRKLRHELATKRITSKEEKNLAT